MSRSTLVPGSIALLAVVVAACRPDAPTAATPTVPGAVRAAATYAATDLGSIDGHNTRANGVNDAGDVAGKAGDNSRSDAVLWLGGAPTVIAAPYVTSSGEARAINDAGHAALVFFVNGSTSTGARGYPRLPDGTLVLLPPDGTDVTSYANDVSDPVGGVVYVAGTTRASQYASRAVRWTVDATTGQIVATEIRSENSHGVSVSDAGGVAGFIETDADRASARSTAFLWRGASLRALAPPRGGKNGHAWDLSPNGGVVAGEAIVGCCQHAVRWTIFTP